MQIVKTLMTSGDQVYWILWCPKFGETLGNGSYLKAIRHGESVVPSPYLVSSLAPHPQCSMEDDTKPVLF